jgi:hypothetical protein
VLSLFAGRLVQLQGMESGTYRKLALEEREHPVALPALRGSITGANGQVLAMTVTTYTIYADPPQITSAKLSAAATQQQVADALAVPLGMAPATILNLLQNPSSQQYVVLATGVSAQVSGQITALGLPGINQTPSYARSYPDGSVAANIIGFTSTKPMRCWLASRAASRFKSAPTASRSRWRAATTSRWSTAVTCGSPSSRRCSTRPSRRARNRSPRPRRAIAR